MRTAELADAILVVDEDDRTGHSLSLDLQSLGYRVNEKLGRHAYELAIQAIGTADCAQRPGPD